MAFRSQTNNPQSYPFHQQHHTSISSQNQEDTQSSPAMRKRQRIESDMPNSVNPQSATNPQQPGQPMLPGQVPQPGVPEDGFIADQDAAESGGDEDEDDEKPKSDKKAGRRKIKIEFIQDKSRRHITFSKRKAGIMKKAYELSTLTGTQVLLLVVSETGLVYTFTTAKLQPLVTQPEGKNLIQACLNAPHGGVPSSLPVGAPMGRATGPMTMPGPTNLPGGLSIPGGPVGGPAAGKEENDDEGDDEAAHGGRATAGDKRRRRSSNAAQAASSRGGPGSPSTPNSTVPPLNIPQSSQQHQQPQGPPPPQIALGSPTSPHQHHTQVPQSPQYTSPTGAYGHPQQGHHGPGAGHASPTDPGMYGGHMMPPPGQYSYSPGGAPPQGGQPLGGLAAAAAQQHQHWGAPPPVGQAGHYTRR